MVTSGTPDGPALVLKELGGTERQLQLAEPGTFVGNTSWLPDGRELAYTVQRGSDYIWVLSVRDQIAARPWLSTPSREHSPSFSPDGRWLAYVSNESGRNEIYVWQYPEGERFTVSTNGGQGSLWGRDGTELFFTGEYQGAGTAMAVAVTTVGDRPEVSEPMPLFAMRSPDSNGVLQQFVQSSNGGRRWDILPDGRFVMERGADVSSAREIVLIQNFFTELERLVPTD